MTVRKAILDFYSRPGAMTSAGKYAALLERLPNDVAALVRIVQGLTLNEFVAGSSEPVSRRIALRLPGSSRRFAMYSLNSASNCFFASRSICSFVKYGIIPLCVCSSFHKKATAAVAIALLAVSSSTQR
jgi:hypothetical protein